MLITNQSLRSLYTGFSAAFQGGFAGVQPAYQRVATTVPSSTRQNQYGWMGMMPQFREWLGDRVLNSVDTNAYAIINKTFEMTVAAKRDDIEDDNLGIYAPLFTEMGRATAVFPDQLVWPLLKNGFATACYDGQYFFDTDHPVEDASGAVQSVSNTGGGAGTPWFLLDVSRALKPIIFQQRRAFEFRRMDDATDEVVFDRAEYRYGVDGRCNVGYGFWQMAYGSKQTLDKTNYGAARAAMMGMSAKGRPLGIMPNLLVVPPTLEGAGRALLNAEKDSAGADNIWKGSAELLVVPWLA